MNWFDTPVFHAINGLAGHNEIADQLAVVFALYSPEMFAVIFAGAWFTLPWSEVSRRHALVIAFLGGLLAFLINNLIGVIWYRPRPFVALSPSSVHQLVQYAPDASFPSDHVALGYGFASGSFRGASPWVTWAFTAVTTVVMIARVYVGVHWPTDVLGGALVGVAAGRLVHLASPLASRGTRLLLRIFRMGPYGHPGRKK